MRPRLELQADVTVREALEAAASDIAAVSDDQPQRQAEWMIAHILNVDRAGLYANGRRRLTPDQVTRLRQFIDRRIKHEPLQYILGTAGFRRINLKTDQRALIPRPETEGLVEIGLDCVKDLPSTKILDIGTGCGAIALSLLDEHPGALVTAVDISREALDLATENGEALGFSDRVSWAAADIFSPTFCDQFDARFDLIIGNPPYVSQGDYRKLPPEIRLYEPALALTDGQDGLSAIRRLADIGRELIDEGRHFVCEIGEGQGEISRQIFNQAGWDASVRRDLNGKLRYLIAR